MQIKNLFNNTNHSVRMHRIRWIVIHYTACLTSAAGVARSMSRNGVSTNYIVDSRDIIHAVDEQTYIAWHVKTNGKQVFCGATNANSLGVDMCEKKLSTATRRAEDNDWYFDTETIEKTAQLVAHLMRTYGIKLDNVVRHYDVTHKQCPRPFVGDDINRYFLKSGEQMWYNFKQLVKRYNEDF